MLEREFSVRMDDLIAMTGLQLAELQELRLTHRRLSATLGIAIRQAQAIQQELVAAMADFRAALDEAGVPWTPGRAVKPPV